MRSPTVESIEPRSAIPAALGLAGRGPIVVSVVIPTYNCARFIGGALKSVAMQSYTDWEIVVVDDGSDDRTRDAVAACGVPCRYVENERRKGPSGARNHGIELCKGRYIAFLDADDAWLPNKLALQIPLLQAEPNLLALGGRMIPWESDPDDLDGDPFVRDFNVQRYNFDQLVVKNRLATPTVVCRRDAFEQVGLFDENLDLSEDFELWLRLSNRGIVGRIDTPLARFRQRPDGLSAGNRDRTFTLDMEFTRSLADRYIRVPNIRRLVKQALAAREFERAIELCDVQMRYGDAFLAVVKSIRYWPWTNPITPGHRLTRLRRIRRIAVNAIVNAARSSNTRHRSLNS